jgi:ribonuclease HIII
MEKFSSFAFALTDAQQSALAGILNAGNYQPASVPYTKAAVTSPAYGGFGVNLYTSGKCLVQGKGAREFIEFVLEPEVLKATPVTNFESTLSDEAKAAHLGVDESGKGDFFGPLVVAAAFSNEAIAGKLKDAGVRDSKAIVTDKTMRQVAMRIHNILGPNRYSIMVLPPRRYNTLYAKTRSINRILAWHHATCLENLTRDHKGAELLRVDFAISDQFGDEKLVLGELRKKGLDLELRQRHRAEEDLAVAAASILARATYVRQIGIMSERFGMQLPKGASLEVREAAAELLKRQGPEAFLDIAKCHFKTLDAVLEAGGFSRSDMPPEGRVVSQAANFDLRGGGRGQD